MTEEELQENEEEEKAKKDGIKLIVGVFGLWLISWGAIALFVNDRGTFGDQFGAVNALFSGMALAGIIYTILLQRKELKLQRKELELTRGVLKDQKEELELTRKEHKDQNVTLQIQRVEVTFFNLLRMIIEQKHDKHVSYVLQELSETSENFKFDPKMLTANAKIGLGLIDIPLDCLRLVNTLPESNQLFYVEILASSLSNVYRMCITELISRKYSRTTGFPDLYFEIFDNRS